MSLELLNTLSTLGTFVVVAAATVAAVVQLRHLRGSNIITALNELRETMETPEFQDARHFIETELASTLEDATFRQHLIDRARRTGETRSMVARIVFMGNFFETLGMLLKAGLVDRNLALEMWCGVIEDAWNRLEPAIALIRESQDETIWENFEYATVLAQDWREAHPRGTYPPGMRRIHAKHTWAKPTAPL